MGRDAQLCVSENDTAYIKYAQLCVSENVKIDLQ